MSTLTRHRTQTKKHPPPHQPHGASGVVAGATTYQVLRVGGNLLSHSLPGAVPSARAGLASGFGKGPGVSPPPSTTDTPKKACTALTNTANICNYLATVSQPTTTHHVVAVLVCCVSDCTVDASTNSLMLLRNAVLPTNHQSFGVLVFIGQLVPVTSTHYYASRSGLSTQSSPGNLKRNLISKQASRLDAFSGYPFRT